MGCDESGGTEDWTAFDEQHEEKDPGAGGGAGGESWASFGPPQTTAHSEEASEDDWQDSQQPITVPPSCSSDSGRTEGATVSVFVLQETASVPIVATPALPALASTCSASAGQFALYNVYVYVDVYVYVYLILHRRPMTSSLLEADVVAPDLQWC